MFTPYMTDEELQAVANRDYLEIRMKVKIAFEQFVRGIRLKRGQTRVIHSIIENKKIRTKSQNIWTVSFFNIGYDSVGTINYCNIYIPVNRGAEVDYLFMNDLHTFRPERLSHHFLQRYKERYLEYNGINLRGMPVAAYYMINNDDRQQTFYFPENWTEEEMEKKRFMISQQGLSLVKVEGQLLTYITFLDQENLNRYKSKIYEEEAFMQDMLYYSEQKDPMVQMDFIRKIKADPVRLKATYFRFLDRLVTTTHKTQEEKEKIEKKLDDLWAIIVGIPE